MPYHQYNPFVTTIPRPSNLNYSQFVESVNRTMNAGQAPQSSFFGSAGLTNEELRRINGPIPSVDVDVHDATERLENMHLDLYAEWHAPQYRSKAPSHSLLSMPPAPYMIESRSRSESPLVHFQGPPPKALSVSASVATTGSTYYIATIPSTLTLLLNTLATLSSYLPSCLLLDLKFPLTRMFVMSRIFTLSIIPLSPGNSIPGAILITSTR